MHIIFIAGARPNFMKIAPMIKEIDRRIEQRENLSYDLVHTGQHYDQKMSGTFFDELNIPKPTINLQVGSGSHAEQTAGIMVKFEQFVLTKHVDLVVVVGDVNSTVACSLVAKKLHIKVAHIEAGLRSYDLTMPEEINRMVTDSITDYFYTTTPEAGQILLSEGKKKDNIYFVGNTMIDTLIANLDRLKKPDCYDEFELQSGAYYLVTLHRPSNVDALEGLRDLLNKLDEYSGDSKIIFPIHPRTLKSLEATEYSFKNIKLVDPQGYLNFIYLLKHCKAVITDSGGIQEEATLLKVPCLTLRKNTERPETITVGSNVLIGDDMDLLKNSMEAIEKGDWKPSEVPDLWDGKTSERIISSFLSLSRN